MPNETDSPEDGRNEVIFLRMKVHINEALAPLYTLIHHQNDKLSAVQVQQEQISGLQRDVDDHEGRLKPLEQTLPVASDRSRRTGDLVDKIIFLFVSTFLGALIGYMAATGGG